MPFPIDTPSNGAGRQVRILRKTDDEFVLVKPLDDGSMAVGLFNLSEARRDIAVTGPNSA